MRIRKVISICMAMVVLLGCFAYNGVAFAASTNKDAKITDGAPTQKTWTFVAEKSGTYNIVFTYARSWKKDDLDSKTVTYTVKVSDSKDTDSTVVALSQNKENALKQGQMFTVTLEDNITTGYEWSYDIKDNGIVFVKTETEPLLGAPVNNIWTFTANKKGTYKIEFTYARAWEKDSTDSRTVAYKIKVSNKKSLTNEAVGLVEGKVNNICKNQNFYITLEENASTGYSWSYKTSTKAIKLANKESVENDGESAQKIWTFQAKKSGTYKLVFNCARTWEKNSSDSQVVEYTVKVTDENNSDELSVALI